MTSINHQCYQAGQNELHDSGEVEKHIYAITREKDISVVRLMILPRRWGHSVVDKHVRPEI